ncbi:MAG: NAD(P)/FAD-dependent oxidoreductase [Bacteroidales bacterium]|jgi:geranylgeranyl reductase family protein
MQVDSLAGVIETDIVIVGGGPAGCSAAFALSGSGKKVLLIDKAVFPREKTCGDSIPGHALVGLENFSPGIFDSFLQQLPSVSFLSSGLVFPDGTKVDFSWTLPGYVAERRIFDHFLLNRVIEKTDLDVITGLKVTDYQRNDSLIHLLTQSVDGSRGRTIVASLVIAADGAPSLAARKLAGITPDPGIYGQAVRCYFDQVDPLLLTGPLVFYHPRFFPGYFWLFPMEGNRVNAGFGMPEKQRRKKGTSITDLFHQFRQKHPVVRQILGNARQISDIHGGMVPFSIIKQTWSGPGFLLTGDAASLVDPVSGDGIMLAVRSGLLAGLAAKNGKLSSYDEQIEKHIWNRMKTARQAMNLVTRVPFLISVLAWLGKFGWFRNLIRKWIW